MNDIRIEHETYIEIKNGLFVDIPDEEFTFFGQKNTGFFSQISEANEGFEFNIPLTVEDIRAAVDAVMLQPRPQDIQVIIHGGRGSSNRFINNMTELETLQYLDRISEEDEHNNNI